VSDADAFGRLDLSCYDGVLAFGAALADRYRAAGWGRRVWTFHEAADAAVFRPLPEIGRERDLVWIGNWGDEERTAELQRFLLEPARSLGVRGSVYGVRYPASGLEAVAAAGLEYGGWLANYRVPEVFAKHRVTVHVPRRPYERELTGIPTIRVFEALACGIPLICAPWTDSEELFRAGDYLGVNDGEEMRRALRLVLQDTAAADELARRGRETVLAKHTCIQRVDELLGIWEQLQTSSSTTGRAASAEVSAWD
jgi:spore maturation protein CgeB